MRTNICKLTQQVLCGADKDGGSVEILVLCGADKEGGTVEILEPPADAEVGELVTFEGFGAPTPDPVLKSGSAQK
ncbi:hypothetical protein T484DRAFT_1820134, partial [Baffinella frigidus]